MGSGATTLTSLNPLGNAWQALRGLNIHKRSRALSHNLTSKWCSQQSQALTSVESIMTVVEEQRCRGTAMGDTAATPTRRHRQPNRQLSLASTPPPPPYRGMPTTQPQSTCVRARLPRAWELPTRENGKIGSGARVSLGISTINKCRFLPQTLGNHTHQHWRQARCGPEANKGKPTAQARGRAKCGPQAGDGKARRPWTQAFCGPVGYHSMEGQSQLRPKGQ